jgi:hypothetical protein
MFGDRGYDSEPLHKIAQRKGNTLFSPERESPRTNPKGWNRRRCAKGDKEYNKRVRIESCIHSLKKRRIGILKSKLHYMKKREVAMQILIHNIEKVSKVMKIYSRMILNIILDKPERTKVRAGK